MHRPHTLTGILPKFQQKNVKNCQIRNSYLENKVQFTIMYNTSYFFGVRGNDTAGYRLLFHSTQSHVKV